MAAVERKRKPLPSAGLGKKFRHPIRPSGKETIPDSFWWTLTAAMVMAIVAVLFHTALELWNPSPDDIDLEEPPRDLVEDVDPLATLATPLRSEEFGTAYENNWHYFPRALSGTNTLESLQGVDERVTQRLSPATLQLVHVHKEGNRLDISSWDEDLATQLATLLGEGQTVVVNAMQRADPAVEALAAEVEQVTGLRAEVNMYISPAWATGISAHHDRMDVVVLQVSGSKRWLVCEPVGAGRTLPIRTSDNPRDPLYNRYDVSNLHQDQCRNQTLAQGDVLYLPRGTIHAPTTKLDNSVHLTIGLLGEFTWEDYIKGFLVSRSLSLDMVDVLRQCLPPHARNKLVRHSLIVKGGEAALTREFFDLPFQRGCVEQLMELRTCADCVTKNIDLMLQMMARARDQRVSSAPPWN